MAYSIEYSVLEMHMCNLKAQICILASSRRYIVGKLQTLYVALSCGTWLPSALVYMRANHIGVWDPRYLCKWMQFLHHDTG